MTTGLNTREHPFPTNNHLTTGDLGLTIIMAKSMMKINENQCALAGLTCNTIINDIGNNNAKETVLYLVKNRFINR